MLRSHTLDDANWQENKHPRGQPGNAGQFASVAGGSKRAPPSSSVAPGESGKGGGVPSASPPPKLAPPEKQVDGAAGVYSYLKMVSGFHAKAMAGRGMVTPAEFLLKNGQCFVANAKTYEGERGPPHECYKNSFNDMLSHTNRFYCEGYISVHGVPIEHAWTCDETGQIYDTTVEPGGHIDGYFGVQFDREYVLKATMKNGYYGLLGHMSRKSLEPLLKGEVKGFKARQDIKNISAEVIQTRIAYAEKVANSIQPTDQINTPERAELRRRLVDEYWDEIKDKPKLKEATIILGLPGIGKSTFGKPLMDRGAVELDPDIFKTRLPEFGGGEGANAVHEESSLLARETRNRMVEAGLGIVWPRIDSPDKVVKDIQSLKDAGYKVNVTYLEGSKDEAVESALNRFINTGRYVSPLTISNYGNTPRESYEAARKTGLLSEAKAFRKGPNWTWSPIGDAAHDRERVPKSEVSYTDGPVRREPCMGCSMFVKGDNAFDLNRCTLVVGEIRSRGHCVEWVPKAQDEFREAEHPRGQPDNPGQFAPTAGGGSSLGSKPGRPSPKKGEGEHPGHGYSTEAKLQNGVIHTPNVKDAVRALYEGREVRLNQPRQVSTLLDKLGAVTQRMVKMGAKAPIFNLCLVSIPDTNLFCAESKGIPRIQMPQVPQKLRERFTGWLTERGFKVTPEREAAEYLRATQDELNGATVAGMVKRWRRGEKYPVRIFVSRDNYIVDGHHRWASEVALGMERGRPAVINIDRIDVDIIDLLKLADEFTGGRGKLSIAQHDAFREADHPRGQPDNPGQFASTAGGGGGKAPEPERPPNKQDFARRQREHIDGVARTLKFPPALISVSDETQTFELNGKRYTKAGVAHLKDGTITIFSKEVNPYTVAGVTVHEIFHQKFQAFKDAYDAEYKQLMDLLEKLPKKHVFDPAHDPMRADGLLRGDWAQRFPTYQLYTQLTMHWLSFMEADGVSEYSYEYWKAWKDGKCTTDVAFHETLAEMARIQFETGRFPDHMGERIMSYRGERLPKPTKEQMAKNAKIWRDLYRAVETFWPKRFEARRAAA